MKSPLPAPCLLEIAPGGWRVAVVVCHDATKILEDLHAAELRFALEIPFVGLEPPACNYTIRSVSWRWLANGFRAFDNLFYDT